MVKLIFNKIRSSNRNFKLSVEFYFINTLIEVNKKNQFKSC